MRQRFSGPVHFPAVSHVSLPFLRSRHRVRSAVAGIGLLLGLALLSSCRPSVAEFAPYLTGYANLANPLEARGAPYIAGKVIAIDKTKTAVDDLHFDLPEELRAKTPDEVGSVAWIRCSESVYGTYTSGSRGYVTNCEVSLIDRHKSTIVAKQSFSGDTPPTSKSSRSDWHGSRPTEKMVKFIAGLPRR